jgi:hypothetical protein
LSRFFRQLKQVAVLEGGLPCVFLALSALSLFTLWNARLLPMLHAPNDMAIARVWHDLRSSAHLLGDYYKLDIRPLPGTLLYFLLHVLMYVLPIEFANKLLLSVYLVCFPLSLWALARALGRSPWLALGAFVLAFNRSWMYGYTGFLLGSTAMFFSFALVIRFLREGGQRRLLILSLLGVMTYFAELIPFALLVMGSLALCVASPRRWRNGLSVLLALGPSLMIALAMYCDEWGERKFITDASWSATYRDFPALVLDFHKRVLDVIPGTFDAWMFFILLVSVLALLLWQGMWRREHDSEARRHMTVLLLTMAIGYTMFPWELKEPLPILNVAARVAPMLAAMLLLLPAVSISGPSRLALLPVLVAAVIFPLKLRRVYRDFTRRNYAFIRLTREMPRGARTLVLMRSMRYFRDSVDNQGDVAASGAIYWGWAVWPTALSGTYSPYLDTVATPVSYKLKLKAPEQTSGETPDLKMIHTYDYFLVRAIAFDSLQRHPALRIVDQVADWTLMQRIFDVTEEP